MANQCVSCKKDVEDDEPAIECDLSDQWEHMSCVRSTERPTESMYQALMENRIKACQEKNCPPKNFILGKKFSASVLKIFVRLAKSCLPDFSSALHVSYCMEAH